MQIAICDNEASCLDEIRKIAEKYEKESNGKECSFSYFSNPYDLLEAVEKNGGFELYLLDIIMPGMNGIELGTKLRDMGCDGVIIYLTSSDEYALDSFKVRALNYIIKPITAPKFYEVLDEVIKLFQNKKDKSILVKSKTRSVKLTLNKIVYAEISKRSVLYHLTDGNTVESLSLRTNFAESVSSLLDDNRFILCGPGMTVNLDHVLAVDNESVVFDIGTVFLSKKVCRDLRLSWSQYLFEGVESKL